MKTGSVTTAVCTTVQCSNMDKSQARTSKAHTKLTLLLTAGWVQLKLQHRYIHPRCTRSTAAAAAAAAAACAWLVLMWQRCTDALPWCNSTRL
jgi:hypothetical protein